jgi:hypothetical protein
LLVAAAAAASTLLRLARAAVVAARGASFLVLCSPLRALLSLPLARVARGQVQDEIAAAMALVRRSLVCRLLAVEPAVARFQIIQATAAALEAVAVG